MGLRDTFPIKVTEGQALGKLEVAGQALEGAQAALQSAGRPDLTQQLIDIRRKLADVRSTLGLDLGVYV